MNKSGGRSLSGVPATDYDSPYSKISRNDFSPDFIFGTSTSAYQVEGWAAKGGRGPSTLDALTLQTPGVIADGSNGNVAVEMYTRYEEDIKMMKSMGFDSYRFSISWSRILPGGRISLGVNREGITYYNNVINCLLENGIEPYVTLFHFDLPQCLELEYGGLLSETVVTDFCEYAKLCFWEFGDRVKNWITINEPWSSATHLYAVPLVPPNDEAAGLPANLTTNLKSPKNHIAYRGLAHPKLTLTSIKDDAKAERNPDKDVYTAARNMLLAHAKAVEAYRTKFQVYQKGKIGITLVSHWFEPKTDSANDDAAHKTALDFMLGWFLEPVLSGQYPENMLKNVPAENMPPFKAEESKLLKGSIDFLGLNYYTATYASAPDASNPASTDPYYKDQKIVLSPIRDGKPIGQMAASSWLYIVPWGINNLLKYINNKYHNSQYKLPAIYITENGVDEKNDHTLTALNACDDKTRVNYLRDHLGNILDAIISDKVNVKGYFVWSWCDNFEWLEGYTVRFGIVYINFANDLTRHPKDSAHWLSKFLVKKKHILY